MMNTQASTEMRSFWWFDENQIAGMGRLGFNSCNWLKIPFDEMLVYGWLGQLSSGEYDLASLGPHLEGYGRALAGQHGFDTNGFEEMMVSLRLACVNYPFKNEIIVSPPV